MLERGFCREMDCLVTVTGVKTAPDIRNAIVFVSVYGSEEQKLSTLNMLRRRRGDIQHQVNSALSLKFTPKLSFRIDNQAETADNIRLILDELGIEGEGEE
ncbi:MAG: ribosome-binding factor A [Rhodothermales bacterium]